MMKNHRIRRRFFLLFSTISLLTAFAGPARAEVVGPKCVFWEGPDVRPTGKGELGMISECPCVLTGIVKNTSSTPAYYANVVVTIRNSKSGELVHTVWTQVGEGILEAGQEEFIRAPLGLSDFDNPDYERKVTLHWKNEPVGEASVDCVVDSTYTRYDENLSALVYGFVKNIDTEAGFAPALEARLLDSEGRTANIVIAQMPRIPLEPGEMLPFSVAIPAVMPTDVIDLSMEPA
jgi:hypothetical protein